MGRADRDDQGGPARRARSSPPVPRRAGRRSRSGCPTPGGSGRRSGASRRARSGAINYRPGADSAEAPAPGAPGCHVRARGDGAPAGAGHAAGALQGPGSAPGRAAHAADGDGRRRGGRRQGEGAAPRPDRRRLLPERDGDRRQGGALCGEGLGVRRRRSPRGEHRGRRVPGHLRHGHDGDDHERAGDAARRAGRLLPSRVREAGAVRERGAHRRQQPGRRAVDRLRRVRGRLFHLLRRAAPSTGCSIRRRCPRRPSGPAASSGRP